MNCLKDVYPLSCPQTVASLSSVGVSPAYKAIKCVPQCLKD